jgi:hypothetical protein
MPKKPKAYKTLLTECTTENENINFLHPDTKQEENIFIFHKTNINDISQIQKDTAQVFNKMVYNNIINKNDNIKDTLFLCNCGEKVLLIHKLKHSRTAKHREYIKSSIQNNNDRKKQKAILKANEQQKQNNEIN